MTTRKAAGICLCILLVEIVASLFISPAACLAGIVIGLTAFVAGQFVQAIP